MACASIPLHISSSRVEIRFLTEFELPRPAGNTISVVHPYLDGGWDWVGWSIVPWSFATLGPIFEFQLD